MCDVGCQMEDEGSRVLLRHTVELDGGEAAYSSWFGEIA